MKEVERWLQMSKDDLNSANSNFKNRKYYVCAFLSHQVVEKALKALLLKKIKRLDLVILGRQINLPNSLLKKCEQLSRVYIETKYGLVGEYIPSQKFKKKNSSEYLQIAREVIRWINKNI